MFDQYIKEVSLKFASGQATEHSYRPALQTLLTSLFKDVQVTNEPKRQACGAPDYILARKNIPFGYIEAKDIGVDLNKVERGGKDDTQWQRYSQSLDNLILTDYLEFRFFLNSEKVETVAIAERSGNTIRPLPENYAKFATLLKDFGLFQGQTIKSARKLAEMMAHKAALMRDVFYKAVQADGDSTLKQQLAAFKEVLMHDMDEAQFADVYAQTIAYGLFTARLHDQTPEDFSRTEALTLIPKSNPFLRQLFHYVAGPDLDERVVWIIDALCEVYRATNLREILKDFGNTTGRNDPIIHFYETFLAEYDPTLRKAKGVWYTPEPVVNFIVRATDDVLKDHFQLNDGLASTAKVEVQIEAGLDRKGKKTFVKKKVHKVQLLDVATGTGTFLAEIIRQIHVRFKGQEGLWGSYVDNDLLPRLHGFELLMASYAMCHMKIDLLLQQTGYKPTKDQKRLGVYLTNSLEEHHPDTNTLFAQWLSREANEASHIKRDMPIMVALGNPPYNNSSSNKGEWITRLMEPYKKGLSERKSNNNEDYIKFIRMAEHYIEKNESGIIAMITNNSYLDAITRRIMRSHLLQTFDHIYLLDLGGDVRSAEVLDVRDENVFDIMQGVCIALFVKAEAKKSLPCKVFYSKIVGTRQEKYELLADKKLVDIPFAEIFPTNPNYFFFPQTSEKKNSYNEFFALNEAFKIYSSGVQTKKDEVAIQFTQSDIETVVADFTAMDLNELGQKYKVNDKGAWKLSKAKASLLSADFSVTPILYRVFDYRYTALTKKSGGFLGRPRYEVMQHIVDHDNVGLIINRQHVGDTFSFVFATKYPCNHGTFYLGNRGQDYLLPLYRYDSVMGAAEDRQPNLNPKIWAAIRKTVRDVTPESLFNYIYAVLHSRDYRARYAEYLKSDFPRIPYPSDAEIFHQLATLGAQVRALHLMESPLLDTLATTYPVGGDHIADKPRWEAGKAGLGRVWINATQYFDAVPQVAWEFYIGGYQPAQKWLKDRKGRALSMDDLRHWQRIIVALTETHRLMDEIDKVDFLPSLIAGSLNS